MTIEEKAKAYDEALKEAVIAHKDEDRHLKATLERIFSELKESEDEKIRKGIRSILEHYKESGEIVCPYPFVSIDDALAWLEKQGESDETKAKMFLMNKGYPIDANGTFPTYDEIYNIIRDGIEKQGEQKSADKVKPKFHEGDWIAHNVANFVFQIVGVGTYGYNVVNREGYAKTISLSNEENYHLWNITDANPGDVLVASDGSIFLFGGVDDSACKYYAALTTDNYIKINKEAKGGYWETSRAVYPATKEQRDQLEKAMADAGYTFDFDKKELKKVEQKSTDNEMIEILRTEYEKGRADAIAEMQNTAWSEEDEMFVHGLIRGLSARRDIHGHTTFSSDCIDITETINWLKSLKERYTWKPSNEQLDALQYVYRNFNPLPTDKLGWNSLKTLELMYHDLKKLKE